MTRLRRYSLPLVGLGAFGTSLQSSATDRFFLLNSITATTSTGAYLAPVGSGHWDSNQVLNDTDKQLDPSDCRSRTFGAADLTFGTASASEDTTFDSRDTDPHELPVRRYPQDDNNRRKNHDSFGNVPGRPTAEI